MEDVHLLWAFVVSLGLIIFMLIKKFNPSFCLIIGGIVAALIAGIPLDALAPTLGTSFTGMLTNSGIMLLFALIYSEYLNQSGGVIELSKALLRIAGPKYDVVAIGIVGYLLGISVSYVCSITIIAPMIKPMSKLTGKPLATYAAAFAVPALLSADTIVPTFGPAMVASALGLNMGWFMLWGFVATLPGFVVSMLIMPWLSKRFKTDRELVTDVAQMDLSPNPACANASLTFAMVMFPIALIIFGAFIPQILEKGTFAYSLLTFVGNAGIAMMITVIVSMVVFNKYLPIPNNQVFASGVKEAGPILIILCAASVYSGILSTAGIGSYFVKLLSQLNMPIMLLSAILLVALHIGTGAGSVSSVTVIPLMRPLLDQTGTSLILFGETIGVAQSIFYCPTDVTYWVYKDLCGLSDRDALQSAMIPNTIVGIVSVIWIMFLNMFASVLPGVF